MNSESILNDALKLRPAERLLLIEWLAKSLSKPNEKIEQIWAEESEKRFNALKDGRVKTISIDEIVQRYK